MSIPFTEVDWRLALSLQVLCRLARLAPGETCTAAGLGRELRSSTDTIQRLMTRLAERDLVRIAAGNRGGYQLGRPASEVTVADVAAALEPALRPGMYCLMDQRACAARPPCAAHAQWAPAVELLQDAMRGMTVAGLAGVGPAGPKS